MKSSGTLSKIAVVGILLVVAALAIKGVEAGRNTSEQTASRVVSATMHVPTRAPREREPAPTRVGVTAPSFAVELTPSSRAQTLGKSGSDISGTLFVQPSTVNRLALIIVIDSDVKDAATVDMMSAARDTLATYVKAGSFSRDPLVDSLVVDVGRAATQAWHDSGSVAGMVRVANATHMTGTQWGFAADEGLTPTPHVVRDSYAAREYPTIALVAPRMRILYLARGRAAANRVALMHAVGQAVIDAGKVSHE